MPETARCPLCQTRKPKRWCPALRASICPVCCGREREVSIRCPFSCEYLQAARKHERLAELDPDTMPNLDVEITREFLDRNALLGQIVSEALWLAVDSQPEAVDLDIREALEALIRTYRTLQSGLVYETRPANRYAAAIASSVRDRIAEMEHRLRTETAIAPPSDSQFMGLLIFFQRTELQVNNGRKLSRAFVDVLRQNHEAMEAVPAPGFEELDPGAGGLILS